MISFYSTMPLTNAGAIQLLIAHAAHTAPEGHQPVAIGPTVELGCVSLRCMLHTGLVVLHARTSSSCLLFRVPQAHTHPLLVGPAYCLASLPHEGVCV